MPKPRISTFNRGADGDPETEADDAHRILEEINAQNDRQIVKKRRDGEVKETAEDLLDAAEDGSDRKRRAG